jgi:hypothetical protein
MEKNSNFAYLCSTLSANELNVLVSVFSNEMQECNHAIHLAYENNNLNDLKRICYKIQSSAILFGLEKSLAVASDIIDEIEINQCVDEEKITPLLDEITMSIDVIHKKNKMSASDE